jgi:S1-C subfamily serine protease
MKLGRPRLEQLGLALSAGLALALTGINAPRLTALLASATPTPAPILEQTPPPAAVLLQEELDQDLEGVWILVSRSSTGADHVGTAFAVDASGDLLTSADLVRGATALRLIDPTGGNHQAGLVAVDEVHDVALLRISGATAALPLGDPTGLRPHDPLALLGPAKAAALEPSTPVTVSALGLDQAGAQGVVGGLLALAGDFRPQASGAPVAGPGGKVMAVAVLTPESETPSGFALPISLVAAELAAWRERAATPALPLAAAPPWLVLRGLDETASGPSSLGATPAASGPPSLLSVAPTRALSSQSTVLTLHGSGFTAGPSLRVHFLASGSLSGSFDGVKASVGDPKTITVIVPAGMRVQDYAIEVVNGDGSVAGSRLAFTVVP